LEGPSVQGDDEKDVDDNMEFSEEKVEPRHRSSLIWLNV